MELVSFSFPASRFLSLFSHRAQLFSGDLLPILVLALQPGAIGTMNNQESYLELMDGLQNSMMQAYAAYELAQSSVKRSDDLQKKIIQKIYANLRPELKDSFKTGENLWCREETSTSSADAINAATAMAKVAASAANVTAAALQAKIMAEEAKGYDDGDDLNVPASILKRKRVVVSNSLVHSAAAKESCKKERVEAATTAFKRAKSVVEAARLASEAVSQAARFVSTCYLPCCNELVEGNLVWSVGDRIWSIGDRVDVLVDGSWLLGVILEKKGDNTVTVLFEEGNSMMFKVWDIRPSLVREDGFFSSMDRVELLLHDSWLHGVITEKNKKNENAVTEKNKKDENSVPVSAAEGPGLGLVNLGRTCYLNSILQCLTHMKSLAEALNAYTCHCGEEFCAIRALQHHIHDAFKTSDAAALNPIDFTTHFSPPFILGEDQDAHEFLLILLEKLEVCEAVIDVFGCLLANTFYCCSCKYVSLNNERAHVLSLGIEHVDSLLAAIRLFTTSEELQKLYCGNCKKTVSKEKKCCLQKTPLVAVFHLKRFSSVSGVSEKISKPLEIPLVIVLQPFVLEDFSEDGPSQYQLYAFVEHIGTSLHNGHYVSYVRTSPQTWHRFDDEKVEEINIDSLPTKNSYIIFYTKGVEQKIHAPELEEISSEIIVKETGKHMKSGKKRDLKEDKKDLCIGAYESDNHIDKLVLTEEEKGEVLSRERHESDLKENQKLAKEKEVEERELTECTQQGELLCRERLESDLKENNKKVFSVQNVKPETRHRLTEEENVKTQYYIKLLANPSISLEQKKRLAERFLTLSEALKEKVNEGLKEVLREKEELVWKKVQKEKKEGRKEKKGSENQNKRSKK